MIRRFHIWLWGMVCELEDILYPWKTSTPPAWAIERHNLPDHHEDELEFYKFLYSFNKMLKLEEDELDEIIYKEWIRAHDEKIGRLQSEMINVQREIHKLKSELEQCMKN